MNAYDALYFDETLSLEDAGNKLNTLRLRQWKIDQIANVFSNREGLEKALVDVPALIAKISDSPRVDWSIRTEPRYGEMPTCGGGACGLDA